MSRLGFGAFLAPHHPIGEHHSSGWEMIGSPEMFLAAAGERSKRIKRATGVVSLPYHGIAPR
jgi:limonene 1,2-monooxygenase